MRYLERVLFEALNFEVNKGEHWALIGPAGSGKSALLNTIAGKFNITGGSAHHWYFDEFVAHTTVTDAYLTYHQFIAIVSPKHSFRNLSNTTDFYYQQRFNSCDSDDAPMVSEYLGGIKPSWSARRYWTFDRVVEKLKLQHLLDKQLIKLSNGETKRVLIAAALLKNPVLLLLDNALTGLDIESRSGFDNILNEIAASGITIIMATSPAEIPEVITNVAILDKGHIIKTMAKVQFKVDMVNITPTQTIDVTELESLLWVTPRPAYEYIVDMKQVNISYGAKQVLNNINWTVRQGEHWALLGPNGAGKSTLLSLINGDNPQAYANHIILFDQRRGTGESIWDIKSKIGFVSPELHQYFPTENTCLQVIESGFYDTLGLFKQSQSAKVAIAFRWMKLLELDGDARKPLKSVSASKQRLVLLARALVKNPSLLIFDEPCQGLDEHQQRHFKNLVNAACVLGNITLIYVTHYQQEIPDVVNRVLKLNNGSVVQGV